MLNVMRQGRGGDPKLRLQRAARKAVLSGAYQRPKEFKADRTAKRFQLARGYFEFHRTNFVCFPIIVKAYFGHSRNKPEKGGLSICSSRTLSRQGQSRSICRVAG